MKLAEPNKLHRKSGIWGTRAPLPGKCQMLLLPPLTAMTSFPYPRLFGTAPL
jgi:hypothetical protein